MNINLSEMTATCKHVIKNRIFRNSAWLVFDQVFRLSFRFFVGAWVARYLGVLQFGQLNFALSIVEIASALFDIKSLNQFVVRDLTLEPESQDEVIGTAFYIQVFGAAVAIFLVLFANFFLIENDHEAYGSVLVIIFMIGSVFRIFSVLDAWFQQKLESRYIVLSRNIASVFIACVKIILISIKAPLLAFAWAISLEFFITSIISMIFYISKGNSPRFVLKFSTQRLSTLIKSAWPLMLSGIAIVAYLRVDQFMLGFIADPTEVGLYAVAVKLSEVWYFLPAAIVPSFMAPIIEARKSSYPEFLQKSQTLLNIMILIAYPIVLVVTIFSSVLISTVYGDQYAGASSVLSIHAWSSIFVYLGIARTPWIIAENKQIYVLFSASFGLIINVLINILLIPSQGAAGAAIATLISYAFSDYISYALYPSTKIFFLMMTKSITLQFLRLRT